MLLRLLVSQILRQAAEKKFHPAAQRSQEPETRDAEDDQSAPEPAPPCEIAVVFAMGVEAGGFVDLLKNVATTKCSSFMEHVGDLNGRRVVVAESGVGRENAARATEDLIRLHQPPWVVSAGFAGALHEDLRKGHFLMANHVADCQGNQMDVGLKMDPEVIAATKGLHLGRLLTVDHIVRHAEEKRKLGQQHDAVACDMETIAVAQVCSRLGVRFLSVRVISDAIDDDLPVEVEKFLGQKSLAGKIGAAAGAILGRPSVVKDMWRLKEDALKATDRLAKYLKGVMPQLIP